MAEQRFRFPVDQDDFSGAVDHDHRGGGRLQGGMKAFFEALRLGNVAGDDRGAGKPASLVMYGGGGQGHNDAPAVLAPPRRFIVDDPLTLADAIENVGHFLGMIRRQQGR